MIFETWQNWSQVIKIGMMFIGGYAIYWQLSQIRLILLGRAAKKKKSPPSYC